MNDARLELLSCIDMMDIDDQTAHAAARWMVAHADSVRRVDHVDADEEWFFFLLSYDTPGEPIEIEWDQYNGFGENETDWLVAAMIDVMHVKFGVPR